jgi:hypothetical protein
LTNWFQGNSSVFPAHSGGSNSYIGANFNNTTGNNTISNWLVTPALNFNAGDVVKFWTRTVTTPTFPDRLEVRYNPLGTTNVGPLGNATAVGDFTTLLLSVNPTLTASGYPNAWTEFTVNIPSSAPAGRLAFRYFVTSGGPSGANSDFIGIDTFSVTEVPEPASIGVLCLGGLGLLSRRRRA